jgi:hypothetical protein
MQGGTHPQSLPRLKSLQNFKKGMKLEKWGIKILA